MIMKRVEEDCKAKILSMKTEYKVVTERERQFNVILFKVVFARSE